MHMYPTVYLMMYGIFAYSIHLFGKYPIRIAIIILTVAGWILLPQAHFDIPHIPFRTRTDAISLALLLGILVQDPGIFKKFRFHWIDIPAICWTISPFISSLTNPELGAYDGLNVLELQIITYTIPYLCGRLYFGSYEALRELAIGLALGAIVIVPLVAVELLVSPQMHTWVYGWYPHDWVQTIRSGGYRPSLFMSHGLELAIWNTAGAFIGWQLYIRKVIPNTLPVLNLPTFPSLMALTLILAASKSSGALMLFFMAMTVFQVVIQFKTKLPLYIIFIIPLLYMGLRGSGVWDGRSLLNISTALTGSKDRTASLEFRMINEDLLSEKARHKILFGWGGFGRSFVFDKDGNPISVPDGRWIILLGSNGLFGLIAYSAFLLMPAFLFILRCPLKEFSTPLAVPAASFGLFLGITMIDNLFNSMHNPVLLISVGGLSTLILSKETLSTFRGDKAAQLAEAPRYFTRTI